MSKKVLIVGSPTPVHIVGSPTPVHMEIEMLKKKIGEDIIVVTPDEAKELLNEDIPQIRPKLTEVPIQLIERPVQLIYKSGKENRRERRAKERKNKKK